MRLRRRLPRLGPTLHHTGVVVMLGVVGWVAGVAATMLFPTHVQTDYYQATVHLQLRPSSTVSVPTVLGDVDVTFDGPVPAPSIVVDSQLRKGVLEAFGSGTPAISTLRPSSQDLDRVIHETIVGLSLRFLVGFVVADLAVILALRAWRGGRRRLTAYAAGAVALVVVAPAFAGWQAFRQDRVANVATTSLLGYARANTDILGHLSHRSAEASRYVISALALTKALQNKFVPAAPDSPRALRVLFVSDIHGIDQYQLMKHIIEDEQVDAVVDSGDLINFGDEQEARVAGIFKGIKSLGIPYLFIAGNHDSSSPKDHRLLHRLAKVPNVQLLQPSDDTYHEVTMAGVRFAGFNDPRYYGDGDPHRPSQQVAARDRFLDALGRRAMPDVLVSHEPPALEGIKAEHTLLVDGHLHTPELDGNRMTVGTFTGGGLFGARIAQDAQSGTEILTGEYSFDIADWNSRCTLTTIRRFTFRNVVQGRPSLDSAKVLNARRIVEAPSGRTCGGTKTPEVTTMRDTSRTAPDVPTPTMTATGTATP